MSTSWNRVASTQLYGHCESMLIWHIIKIIMNSPVVIEQIMEPFSSKQPLVYSTTFFILACFCLRVEWSNTPSPCCYWWPFRHSPSFAWGSLFCGQERWGIRIKFQLLYQCFTQESCQLMCQTFFLEVLCCVKRKLMVLSKCTEQGLNLASISLISVCAISNIVLLCLLGKFVVIMHFTILWMK